MEIKYDGNFHTQGHPKIPDKRGRYSNRRLSI